MWISLFFTLDEKQQVSSDLAARRKQLSAAKEQHLEQQNETAARHSQQLQVYDILWKYNWANLNANILKYNKLNFIPIRFVDFCVIQYGFFYISNVNGIFTSLSGKEWYSVAIQSLKKEAIYAKLIASIKLKRILIMSGMDSVLSRYTLIPAQV